MRVIAGDRKGHPLVAPPGIGTRPTTDRVKEAMFSLMGIHWQGGTVLDLFAGSGALGIEALSRGAEKAIFVDRDLKSIRTIRENLQRCHVEEVAEVWRMDWKLALEKIYAQLENLGWVFVDPPYAAQLWVPVLQRLHEMGISIRDGLVCEHPFEISLPEQVGRFQILKSKKYGEIALTIYMSTDSDRG